MIEIEKEDYWCYQFFTYRSDSDIWRSAQKYCSYCGREIVKIYSYIIDNLREANLLPEDYKLICCYCQTLQKCGLMELNKHLNMIDYNTSKDILIISFALPIKERIMKREYIFFYIHDFSKIGGLLK